MCIYKWRIKLDEFDFNPEIPLLEKYGIEVNMVSKTAIMRLLVLLDDPISALTPGVRINISNSLRALAVNINPESQMKQIFDTVINHILHNPPYQLIHRSEKPIKFEQEIQNEFMNNVKTLVDSLLQQEANPSKSDSERPTIRNLNYQGITDMPIPKYTPYPNFGSPKPKLDNIRAVEKLVTYQDTEWKVNYYVAMGADEMYTHRIDVCDYKDFDNKSSIIIKTDSHFIQSLDEKIKEVIIELKKKLWTIDRFEKWSGDLGS
jgi:hypothetical protein